MLKNFLIFSVLITTTLLLSNLQFFEQIITTAPRLIASLIYSSPFILFPLIAKKIYPFCACLLLMAKIADIYSKKIYVTDDNPRNENPKKIRNEIIKKINPNKYF